MVSHQVNILKDGNILLGLKESNYTTKYSYFKELAVNVEIAAFNWGAEDEIQDIEIISAQIINDLSKVGK